MTNEPMTNEPITTNLLESIKADLLASLQLHGKLATGQTEQQITITSNGNTAQLQFPGYLPLLETGRGPTSPNAQPSDPPMIERIQQWCNEKGIPASAAWAIKKSIDKNGFKGIPGLLTTPLGNDNINQHLEPILENMANNFVAQIEKAI